MDLLDQRWFGLSEKILKLEKLDFCFGWAAANIGCSWASAGGAESVLREITGRQRDRVFQYDAFFSILSAGEAPLQG